jgi:hypothetical protein
MSVDPVQPPRLLGTTSAGPVELGAVASVAAAAASDVFSADVREERSTTRGMDLVVTAPLAHEPSVRLHLTWVDAGGSGSESDGPRLEVSLDVDLLDPTPVGERGRRTQRAVDRFAELLEEQLVR